jgi:type I restriction enzyme S subunit
MRDGWTETTLGEVSTFENARLSPAQIDSANRYVGLEHLDSRQPSVNRWGTVGDVTSQVTPFKRDDVLFGRLRPYVHKVATPGFSGVCSPEILVLRATDRCLPRYLQFICSLDSTVGRCVEMSAGTRMPRTSSADLATLPVLLPPLPVQKRIVDLVASVDAYIESLQAQVDAARAARHAVLRDLLSAAGDDWTETTIGSVADVVGGGTPSTKVAEYWNGDIIWLTPTEIVAIDGGVVMDSSRKISPVGLQRSGAKMLPVGTVILTSRASVGFVALAGCPLSTNQGFQSLVPMPGADSRFLMYWVQANREEFVSRSAGSTFKEISNGNVCSIRLALPPLNEQRRIVDVVLSMDEMISTAERALSDARTLRSGLLANLLSGEHEIPESYDRFLGAA